MQILVTGAAGFIGSAVASALVARGSRVTCLDNFNDYYDVQLKRDRIKGLLSNVNCQFIEGDLKDRNLISRLFKDQRFDRVIHLGAQAGVRYSLKNPISYVDSNLVGFGNILEGCRFQNTPHLVYASSSSVYGANTRMPFSEHDVVDHPLSLYAATKKANELMAHSYSHLYGLPTTGLRFFTVYGPWGRPDMAVHIFTKAIIQGEPIKIFNHGKMKRDMTYIEDIVRGVLLVSEHVPQVNSKWDSHSPDPATSAAPYRVYNIGNHQPVELMTLIETLENLVGREAKKEFVEMQAGDVLETFADVDDLARAVGFRPSTSVEHGLQEFVAWFRSYYAQV